MVSRRFLGPALLLLSVGSARATPASRKAPASFRVTVSVVTSAGTRVHELALSDDTCASAGEKNGAFEDVLDVCMHAAPNGIVLSLHGTTEGRVPATGPTTRYEARGEATIARGGGTLQLGRADATHFIAAVTPGEDTSAGPR